MTKAKTKELFTTEENPTQHKPLKDLEPEAPGDLPGCILDDSVPVPVDLSSVAITIPKEEVESTAIRPLSMSPTKNAIEEAKQRILERAEAEAALRQAALGFTTHRDWIFHEVEGNLEPYLEETGSEKLMHAFGIEIEIDKVVLEDYREQTGEADDFEVVAYGRVRAQVFSTLWYPVIGSRWAGDGFFSRAGTVRVDPGDVRKAAYASIYNRAIKKALGLRGVTKEDLDRVPTIEVEKIRTVSLTRRDKNGGDAGLAKILAGKHIVCYVPYEDVTNRKRVSGVKGARFHKPPHPIMKSPNVWVAPYDPKTESLVADLSAENPQIKWRVVDPSNGGGK